MRSLSSKLALKSEHNPTLVKDDLGKTVQHEVKKKKTTSGIDAGASDPRGEEFLLRPTARVNVSDAAASRSERAADFLVLRAGRAVIGS